MATTTSINDKNGHDDYHNVTTAHQPLRHDNGNDNDGNDDNSNNDNDNDGHDDHHANTTTQPQRQR
jgi:hypothetical protein